MAGALALLFALAACTGAEVAAPDGAPSTSTDEPPRIVLVTDLPPSIARSLDTPAFEGASLAAEQRSARGGLPPVDVELRNLTGDAESERATIEELTEDPAVAAVLVGPFAPSLGAQVETLTASGVPVVSLSPEGGPPASGSEDAPWRRIVPPTPVQARTAAVFFRSLPGAGTRGCVAGPGVEGRWEPHLWRALGRPTRIDVPVPPDEEAPDPDLLAGAVGSIGRAGCQLLVWTGGPESGGALQQVMAEAGLGRVVVAGTDATRSEGYVDAAAGTAEGTLAACACVELTASTSLDAQRFVNDFQFAAGVAPGPYAAEGFDAAGLVLEAMRRGGAADRAAVAAGLAATDSYRGLVTDYRFTTWGGLAADSTAMYFSRVEGGRWLEVGTVRADGPLDLPADGRLVAIACRAGPPYAIGTPPNRGFDVDLMRALGRPLGLRTTWGPSASCSGAIERLRNGVVDLVTGVPAATAAAATTASRVYLNERQAIVVRAGSEIRGATAVPPRSVVAVVRASAGKRWAHEELAPRGVRVRAIRSEGHGVRLVSRGKVDALIVEEVAGRSIAGRRGRLRFAGAVDVGDRSAILVAQGRPGLLSALDSELARLVRSGEYGRILDRWFPGSRVPRGLLVPG